MPCHQPSVELCWPQYSTSCRLHYALHEGIILLAEGPDRHAQPSEWVPTHAGHTGSVTGAATPVSSLMNGPFRSSLLCLQEVETELAEARKEVAELGEARTAMALKVLILDFALHVSVGMFHFHVVLELGAQGCQ